MTPVEALRVPDPGRTDVFILSEDYRKNYPALYPGGGWDDDNQVDDAIESSRALRVAVSILLHATVITVPVCIGLFFTDSINF